MSKHLAKIGKKNSPNSDRLRVRVVRQGKNTQYTVYNLPLAIHQVVELTNVVASLSLLWYLMICCLHANLTCRILPGASAWLASGHTYKRHSHRTQEYLPGPVESNEYSPALEILKIRINLPECETDRTGEKKWVQRNFGNLTKSFLECNLSFLLSYIVNIYQLLFIKIIIFLPSVSCN